MTPHPLVRLRRFFDKVTFSHAYMDETPAEVILRGMQAVIRGMILVLLAAGVIMVVLALQTTNRNDDIDQLEREIQTLEALSEDAEVAANKARDAAISSQTALEDALQQAQSRTGVDPVAVTNALQAIHRMEVQLCGTQGCPVSRPG